MVGSNLETFNGKPVVDFNSEEGIKLLDTYVYRLGLDYESIDEGHTMAELIAAFAETPLAATAEELIIGQWDYDSSHSSEAAVNKLVELKDTFSNLKALFIGDMTSEEMEISWILQSDVSPILAAYPQLEHLQLRGGTDLRLSALNHDNLKTLIIEAGGLSKVLLNDIANAQLPNLEHLELWLGTENYGFDGTIEDIKPIIHGGQFPKLTYLGLENCDIQDEIAQEVAQAAIVNQLHTLDLSMGILTDAGARALLDSPLIKTLQFLNLDHHYMSNEMMAQLKGLGISVSMNGQLEEEDYDGEIYRYVEVGE